MNPKSHLLWELDTEGLLTARYIHLHEIRRALSVSTSVPPWTVKTCLIDHEIQCQRPFRSRSDNSWGNARKQSRAKECIKRNNLIDKMMKYSQ